ncbi:Eco57I restriction-modification methylase domain-containing protein [Streptomyces sp. NPDC051684]|uniref:Eco57I restriction-modification methylase domain-containing protein n=1 Tax=Streptomyces sp. NPDC051684 TaxID=3365670 RepID=UPI00378FAEAC
MPPATRTKVPHGHIPSPEEQHEEWLKLLRPDGPFVSLPVLKQVFPQGLDDVPKDTKARLRQAWAEVQASPQELRHGWENLVLSELLGWRGGLKEGAELPPTLRAGANTPDAALLGPSPEGLRPRVILFRTEGWADALDQGKGDQPSLLDRAADLARWREVPLAVVTNGRVWALVHARPKEAQTVALFDADLWFEEPLLLRAFASLLHARRAALPATDPQGEHTSSLAALFARTADEHAEVTDTLGRQVRAAVSLLVAELSRLDRESRGELLAAVEDDKRVYESALTVMMRLVFLLYAEEQHLLPYGADLYDDSYGVGPLHEELKAARALDTDETIDRRAAAWPRLLALFGAIHGGCLHDELWIPAYGGSLFDPARFPWLTDATVTDQVVYEILHALLTLRRKGVRGEEALSYKGLDVEQIGHVYEGLLEYGCTRATEPYVGVVLGRDRQYDAVLPLADLEAWHAQGGTALATALKAATGGVTASQVTSAMSRATGTVTAELHAAADNDEALAARVAAFLPLVGEDLRDAPMVYPAGSVVMVRSGDRRNTGTHYTPKELAEEVVEHTLAPMCFSPVPADGAEQGVRQAKSADELLKLRVLDPAMGSGAFLVSACRYLSERVVEAWLRDGLPREIAQDVGEDDHEALRRVARRLVANSCLYGVDRDPMAVELAKLSLWLVTLSKDHPFSFLDHALRCGDSLLGVTDVAQVEAFHLDWRGRQLSEEVSRALEVTQTVLSDAATLRTEIEATPVDDIRDVRAKSAKLHEAEALSERLRLAADAVVGAALAAEGISDEEAAELTGEENTGGTRGRARFADAKEDAKARAYRYCLESVAGLVATAVGGGPGSEAAATEARGIVDGWLKGPRAAAVRPLHWPLEFPEIVGVGGSGGFDAVVGNPPFIGGKKLTGALGQDYREYLVNRIAGGTRGHADLCAYFLLRNLSIAPGRRTGIIATNTIAQGDTREVGLDRATEAGWTVYRAVKTQEWPGTASVVVSLVWLGGEQGAGEEPYLDGKPVQGITSGLDPRSRVSGKPYRLAANEAQSYQGSIVLGKGFVLEPEVAEALIAKDPRNKDVLFPYLNGEDLNQRPGSTASRWVINFHDWSEEEAAEYEEVFEIAERDVKPVRQRKKDDGTYALRTPLPQRWWHYADKRPELYAMIADLERVIVIARVSKTAMPALIPTDQVVSEQIIVFPLSNTAQLSALSSSLHYWWTLKHSGDMRGDLRYTPSDAYETFPRPDETPRLHAAGDALESAQHTSMSTRTIGLTKLYNLVHDESETAPDIQAVRDAHVEVDQAVAESYSWQDLDLKHGFYDTRQGPRYTIAPDVQTEVLDRLLELNHARYQAELEAGLHNPDAKKRRAAARKEKVKAYAARRRRSRAATQGGGFEDDGLFPEPDALF